MTAPTETPFKLTAPEPDEPRKVHNPDEQQLPKPSGWKWQDGERRTWWYKETVYGVKTGCPCCGRSDLGYGVMRHRKDCPRRLAMSDAAPPPPMLGALVRERRREAGLTLRGLAYETGLSAADLGRIERGVWAPPNMVLAQLFANLHETHPPPLAPAR